MLRTVQSLPPTGLVTLGFDPARFQTEPPACYRAPWRLPGPDSHRLATASLSLDSVPITSNCLGAPPLLVEKRTGAGSHRRILRGGGDSLIDHLREDITPGVAAVS
jgi:hypothetical protein